MCTVCISVNFTSQTLIVSYMHVTFILFWSQFTRDDIFDVRNGHIVLFILLQQRLCIIIETKVYFYTLLCATAYLLPCVCVWS